MSSRNKVTASLMALALSSLLMIVGIGSLRAEVAYTTSNRIAVVDIDKGEVLTEVPIDHLVTDVLFTSSGDRAFVAASNGVTVVDAREHSIVGHLTDLPAKTLELSPDNSTLYVLDHPMVVQEDGTTKGGPYQIEVVDLSTGKVTGTHPMGENYFDIYLSGDGKNLYALKGKSSEIEVFETASWEKVRTISVDTTELLWRSIGSRTNGELYVPQYGLNANLWVVNTQDGSVRKVALNENLALRGITFVPETNRLYLLALGQLLVIDTKSGAVVNKTALSIPYQGMTRSNDGKQLYLANPISQKGGSVTVMDGESLSVVKVIDVPTISPFFVATRP